MKTIKPKKCKGTGLAKGYGCGKITEHRKRGLGKMCCYADWLLNSENGKIELEKTINKVTKPRKEIEALKTKKKERKTLSLEIEKTQKLVNKYVRLRDQGKPCISQNIPYTPDAEAGHLYPKNQFSAIRFDLDNIHGQSIYANRNLKGDFENYIIRVEKRIGKERLEILKNKAAECKINVKQWSFDELKQIQKDIKIKIERWK